MVRTIFITVGTTLFEALIECVSNSLFLNHIAAHGFNRLVIQYGKGKVPNLKGTNDVNQDSFELINEGVIKGIHQIKDVNENVIDIEWEAYRFKPSLELDMNDADLIISHAGAGSIMEGMEHCRRRNDKHDMKQKNDRDKEYLKKLIVVINDKLMDNHQCELAYALERRKYLHVLSQPQHLLQGDVIRHIIHTFVPKCFEGGNDNSFGTLMDSFMGHASKTD